MIRTISTMSLLSVLALTGCESSPHREKITLYDVPQLPSYQAGDTYIFDDGSVEKVVSTQGELIHWESHGGAMSFTRHRNFIIPKLQWETHQKRVTNQYSGEKHLLWPLQQGKSAFLSTIVAVQDKPSPGTKSYIHHWRCHVEEAVRIEVAAGRFETQKIECRRTSVMGRWMQTRTWYYAPSVGHYVFQQDEYAPTKYRRHLKRRREMVAAIPSDLHRSGGGNGAEHHFQQSLEAIPSGETSEWTDPHDRHGRKITLLRTFQTVTGRFCRDYRMERRGSSHLQQFQGTACRSDRGRWQIAVARPALPREEM